MTAYEKMTKAELLEVIEAQNASLKELLLAKDNRQMPVLVPKTISTKYYRKLNAERLDDRLKYERLDAEVALWADVPEGTTLEEYSVMFDLLQEECRERVQAQFQPVIDYIEKMSRVSNVAFTAVSSVVKDRIQNLVYKGLLTEEEAENLSSHILESIVALNSAMQLR